jgi:dolichol kinase
MTFHENLIGSIILCSVFIVILALAELWSRVGHAKPEWTRKFVHFGGGLLCLTFPWVVDSPWFILVVAALSSSVIALGRRGQLLRSLHKVERTTWGSEYYPPAVFVVYLMSHQEPWLYLSSVLVLAVADACAALVGKRFGTFTYNVEESCKSIQGSMAFLVVAFIAMMVPMWFLADFTLLHTVLCALLVAVLVTGFEAISLRGTDNLFIPIGVCAILAKITSKSVDEVLYQLASLALICGLMGIVVWRVGNFNAGGAITFILFAYGVWSLGSEQWAAPVVIAFLVYAAMWKWKPLRDYDSPQVKVTLVFRAVVVPLLVLVVGNMLDLASALYVPFVTAVSIVLSFSLWNHLIRHDPRSNNRSSLGKLIGVSLLSTAATGGVGLLLISGSAGYWPLVCIMGVVTLFVSLINGAILMKQSNAGYRWTASHITLTVVGTLLMVQVMIIL